MAIGKTRQPEVRARAAGRWAALCVGAFTALAALQGSAAAAESSGQQYKVSPGDRLTVTVLGQSELSGDFVVDGEGVIQLPLTGPITVANLTVTQARERIYQILSDGILTKPALTVRISEMQPVFVLGHVRTPGAYPFRFNSTVKSALALAGGSPAPQASNLLLGEFLQAEERYRQLGSQLRSLQVRKARLEAERDGKSSFVVPITGTPDERADLLSLLEQEREALRSAVEDRREQLEQLGIQKRRVKESIDALNEQLNAMRKRIALAQEKTEIYSGLERKGYGRRASKIDALLVEANNESDLWRLRSEISAHEARMSEIDARSRELTTAHKRKISADLSDLGMRLRDVEASLPTARELREVRLQLASFTSAPADGDSFQYTITRTRNGVTDVRQVSDTTQLEPGDVVEVKQTSAATQQIQAHLPERYRAGSALRQVSDVKASAEVEARQPTSVAETPAPVPERHPAGPALGHESDVAVEPGREAEAKQPTLQPSSVTETHVPVRAGYQGGPALPRQMRAASAQTASRSVER